MNTRMISLALAAILALAMLAPCAAFAEEYTYPEWIREALEDRARLDELTGEERAAYVEENRLSPVDSYEQFKDYSTYYPYDRSTIHVYLTHKYSEVKYVYDESCFPELSVRSVEYVKHDMFEERWEAIDSLKAQIKIVLNDGESMAEAMEKLAKRQNADIYMFNPEWDTEHSFSEFSAQLYTYRDPERTEELYGEWTPGEKVYYTVKCPETFHSVSLRVDGSTYIDGEYFIPGEGGLSIYIDGFMPGDVTGDHRINARDVTLLMKYLVGNTAMYWENYGKRELDFNLDSKINAKDVTALMKYIVKLIERYKTNEDPYPVVEQTGVIGVRAANALGDALFAFPYDDAGEWGEYAVIRDKAALEAALAKAVEPTEAEKEFIVSPSEYLASVTDETFAERTLIIVSTGTNGGIVAFEGAYFVNETLVPVVSVYDGMPGIDCDSYDAHFIIIAVEPIASDRAVEPHMNLYYPL